MSNTPEGELRLNLEGPTEEEFMGKMKEMFPNTWLRGPFEFRFGVDMNGVLEISLFFRNRPHGPKSPLSDHILEVAEALGYPKAKIITEVRDEANSETMTTEKPEENPKHTPTASQKSAFDPLGNQTEEARSSDRYNDPRYG